MPFSTVSKFLSKWPGPTALEYRKHSKTQCTVWGIRRDQLNTSLRNLYLQAWSLAKKTALVFIEIIFPSGKRKTNEQPVYGEEAFFFFQQNCPLLCFELFIEAWYSYRKCTNHKYTTWWICVRSPHPWTQHPDHEPEQDHALEHPLKPRSSLLPHER